MSRMDATKPTRPDDETKATILAALERRRERRRAGQAPITISAQAIARYARIRTGGSLDSQKRGVRTIIDELRKVGSQILASYAGYYLPVTARDFSDYESFRHRMGLAHLAAEAKARQSTEAQDVKGQLELFAANTVRSDVKQASKAV